MDECQCGVCKHACEVRAGWLMPGDAERIAAFLGISLQELFRTRLAVDYWLADDEHPPVFILAPVVYGAEPGEVYPFRPYGVCTFYKDGLCEVHPVKPFECAEMMHGDRATRSQARHREIAEAWQAHQEQLTALYDGQPVAPEPSLIDGLAILLGMRAHAIGG